MCTQKSSYKKTNKIIDSLQFSAPLLRAPSKCAPTRYSASRPRSSHALWRSARPQFWRNSGNASRGPCEPPRSSAR